MTMLVTLLCLPELWGINMKIIISAVFIIGLMGGLLGCGNPSDSLDAKCWSSVRNLYSHSGIRDPGETIDRSDSMFNSCVKTKGQGFF